MKTCHARSCGMFPVVRNSVSTLTALWENTQRTFVGVDVSSTCTGLSAIRFREGRVWSIHSSAVDMKKKASDTKDHLLHRRFDILKNAFVELRKANEHIVRGNWEISIEDKIMRAGTAKGIIGSHTLAEVIVAARIAAYQVFPECVPSKINPRSARAGLGLNTLGEGSGREETKNNVLAFVKSTMPDGFSWTGKTADTDRADAFIVALSAIRAALNRELCLHPAVWSQFSKCHTSASLDSFPSKKNEIRKFEQMLRTELDDRMQSWVDDIWLSSQFPKQAMNTK